MREIGRGGGGALVAAAVAQLENKTHTRLTKKPAPPKKIDMEKPSSSTKLRDQQKRQDSSSSDNEDPKEDKDSEVSERDTSEVDELSSSSSASDSEEDSDDDRTLESVLERIEENGKASPDRGYDSDTADDSSTVRCTDGASDSSTSDSTSSENLLRRRIEDTSTCCDDDFQWIKSETSALELEPNDHVPISPAPDSEDEDQRRKIVKSKRIDVPQSKVCSEKPPINSGSLDRRRHHPPNRMERDQKSRSSHNLKTTSHYSPSRLYNNCNDSYHQSDAAATTDYCNNRLHEYTPPTAKHEIQRRAISYEQFNRRHEHNDPQRYGSNCLLSNDKEMRDYNHRYNDNPYNYYYNSRPDLHGSHSELYYGGGPPPPHYRHGMECYCHPSPYWCSCADQSRYRTHYGCKNQESDDRVRRLESDKDSLQLQVSVLSEQIAAQTEKITDLERLLGEKRTLLVNAEEMLQREILTRSSLETQKLELLSTASEARLRLAALERENLELKSSTRNASIIVANGGVRRTSHSPSPSPSPASGMMRENLPRTPPATYRRLVNDQPHSFSSLPRGASLGSAPSTPRTTQPLDTAVVLRSVGFADKDTIIGTASSPILGKVSTGNKGWGSLFKGGSGGALEDINDSETLDPFQRGGVRATAAPRLQSTPIVININTRWNAVPIKEWDADITCEWFESLGLECYNTDAKKWLTNHAGNKGILATASPQQIEKELNIKNPLHKKKILLALLDIQGLSADPLLAAAGRLDSAWTLRWLEDAGLPQYREAWAAARADGRVLHQFSHEDLHTLKVTSQLHALSIRRGIQVLRENNFSPDTMIRRGTNNDINVDGENEVDSGHVSRWSSHRVMEWLRAVDLAEYAPNLRGAGVHGGLMYYEVRFTGELLATLLNIPPSKTLLRRHLNTRFNQLLGKEIIQEKREAEQTLGYQPLTLTSKVKVVKKGQFTLKRKKSKNEPEYGDLVCPIIDQASGEILSMTKMEISGGESVACRTSDEMSNSTDSPLSQRSDNSRS